MSVLSTAEVEVVKMKSCAREDIRQASVMLGNRVPVQKPRRNVALATLPTLIKETQVKTSKGMENENEQCLQNPHQIHVKILNPESKQIPMIF